MPVDAIIRLDRVLCHAESDGNGHSEPYVWTLLIWVDDTTLATPQLVGVSAPGNVNGSRAVIKEGMKAGEQASLPAVQRSFAHRFEDDLDRRIIGVVVAMFEWDETPTDAIRSAYSAFVRELPRALARFISTHLRGPENDREEQEIAAEVSPKVRAAGEDALSNWEKIRVALGTLNLDDEIGFDSWFTAIETDSEPANLRLSFENDGNHYEIEGRFELREPPAPDPCQAQVDGVSRAAATVNGLESTIQALQAELRQAPPGQKPGIIREIRRIRAEELPAAVAALELARRALALCRIRQDVPVGPVLDPDIVADPAVILAALPSTDPARGGV